MGSTRSQGDATPGPCVGYRLWALGFEDLGLGLGLGGLGFSDAPRAMPRRGLG